MQIPAGVEAPKSLAPFRVRLSAGLLAATALSVLLAGARCSAVFEKPELQFRGIQVNSIGFDGASVEILVDVYNPNAYRLGIERLSYDLAVENVHWGVGSTVSPMAVEGRNSATLRLPLDVSWSRLGDAGREALRTGSVNYGVSGEMTLATSLGAVNLPYSKSGRFSVFTGQESSDPDSLSLDLTTRFRLAGYSTETATPFSKTTFLPTLL